MSTQKTRRPGFLPVVQQAIQMRMNVQRPALRPGHDHPPTFTIPACRALLLLQPVLQKFQFLRAQETSVFLETTSLFPKSLLTPSCAICNGTTQRLELVQTALSVNRQLRRASSCFTLPAPAAQKCLDAGRRSPTDALKKQPTSTCFSLKETFCGRAKSSISTTRRAPILESVVYVSVSASSHHPPPTTHHPPPPTSVGRPVRSTLSRLSVGVVCSWKALSGSWH